MIWGMVLFGSVGSTFRLHYDHTELVCAASIASSLAAPASPVSRLAPSLLSLLSLQSLSSLVSFYRAFWLGLRWRGCCASLPSQFSSLGPSDIRTRCSRQAAWQLLLSGSKRFILCSPEASRFLSEIRGTSRVTGKEEGTGASWLDPFNLTALR